MTTQGTAPANGDAVMLLDRDRVVATIDFPGLDIRQRAAVALLAQGLAGVKVAEELGIAISTLTNWKNQPTFKAALTELVHRAWDECWTQIRGGYVNAISRSAELLGHEDPRIALRAAELLLRATGTALQLKEQREARMTSLNRATLESEARRLRDELAEEARAELARDGNGAAAD